MATIKKAQNGAKKSKYPSLTEKVNIAKTLYKDNPGKVYSDAVKNSEKNLTDSISKAKTKKKMKNGGSLSGLKASTKRVGPVDPKGAFTKVQKKTLAGAKGKASLTKDKQLGATKMAKKGMSVKKK
jgi:hypothetical protein